MQGTITYGELGILIAFLIFLGIGIYAVFALKNLNLALKKANVILEDNRDEIDRIIPDIAEMSEEATAVSGQMVDKIGEAARAVETISCATVETIARISETADRIDVYASAIEDTLRNTVDSLSGDRRC